MAISNFAAVVKFDAGGVGPVSAAGPGEQECSGGPLGKSNSGLFGELGLAVFGWVAG